MKNLTPHAFSARLVRYAAEVEAATGREVVVSAPPQEPTSLAELDVRTPYLVDIKITADPLPLGQYEWLVAHKFGHAELVFVKKYPSWSTARRISAFEAFRVRVLQSIPMDIAADAGIYERGFGQNVDVMRDIKRVLRSLKHGQEAFRADISPARRTLDRAMLGLYSFGMVTHSRAFRREAGTVERFLVAMARAYPAERQLMKNCRAAIAENDIFTAEGYARAFRGLLDAFGIEGVEVGE